MPEKKNAAKKSTVREPNKGKPGSEPIKTKKPTTKPEKKPSKKAGETPGKKPEKKPTGFDLEAALAALPPEASESRTTIPISEELLQAQVLLKAAQKHQEALLTMPFEHELFHTFEARINALNDAELKRQETKKHKLTPAHRALEKSATELRSEMIAALRYLLRKDEAIQDEVDAIIEGDGIADLIADLKHLASIFNREAKRLVAYSTSETAQEAATKAEQYAASLTKDRVAWEFDKELHSIVTYRNRCVFLLREAAMEIRAAARFAFRKEPEIATLFVDRARASRLKASRSRKKTETTEK